MDLTVTSWILTPLIGYLLVKLLMLVTRSTAYARMVDKIPGPPAVPLLGNAWDFWVPFEDLFSSIVNLVDGFKKESLVRLWLGTKAYVMVTKASSIETILSNVKYSVKSDDYSHMHSWLGMGLLTSSLERWQTHRKMLTPSFHFRILNNFVAIFNEQSRILVEIVREKAKSGEKFDLLPYISRLTLDIICETAMDKSINAQRDSESEYVKAVRGMATIVMLRIFRPWLRPNFLYNLTSHRKDEEKFLKTLHSFSRKVVKERRQILQEKNVKANDGEAEEEAAFGAKKRLVFLDTLLEASSEDGKRLTDEDIREQVDTFVFAGHDTTASGISFAIYLLGRHPEIQRKVQDELEQVLGPGSERAITPADLAQLKYTEAVIKESLRLYPSVPLVLRKLKEKAIIDGHVVPPGTTLIICLYMAHHDPEIFPDPEKFDPDRFLSSSAVGRHPFAFVPFSAGPRNCIGQKFALMEEKVALAEILRHFDVVSHDPPEDLKLLLEAIIRPAQGIMVTLKERNL